VLWFPADIPGAVTTTALQRSFAGAVDTVCARFDGWNGRSIGAIAHASFMFEAAARRLWAGDGGSNRAVRWADPFWVRLADSASRAKERTRVAIIEADARGDLVAVSALKSCNDQIDRSLDLVIRWGYEGLVAAGVAAAA
jgi:hypothetical protein